MQKRIGVEQAVREGARLVLTAREEIRLKAYKPAGRMLADSDNLALIYILESENEFHYVSIPSVLWGDLKTAYDEEIPVFLQSGENELELKDIHSEMNYLVDNIEGNANYGDEMETEVVRAFGDSE